MRLTGPACAASCQGRAGRLPGCPVRRHDALQPGAPVRPVDALHPPLPALPVRRRGDAGTILGSFRHDRLRSSWAGSKSAGRPRRRAAEPGQAWRSRRPPPESPSIAESGEWLLSGRQARTSSGARVSGLGQDPYVAYSAAWDASQEKLPINGVEGVELAWPYGCLESARHENEFKTVVQMQGICRGPVRCRGGVRIAWQGGCDAVRRRWWC